jgi:threonine synthase
VKRDLEVPMITLATAHPAKFPDAIAKAIGRQPAVPASVAHQAGLPERINRVPGDVAEIAKLIEARTTRRRSV